MRGGFESERFTKLLDEIDGDSQRIAALTENAVDLEPIRLERKRKLNGPYWIGLQNNAKRLFGILSSSWSSACPCRHAHRANLRLDVRRGHDITQNSVRFAFVFSFDEDITAATSIPWDWRDVEIETLDTVTPWVFSSLPNPKGKMKVSALTLRVQSYFCYNHTPSD